MSHVSGQAGGEDIAVTRFREYLRVKTVHPKPDYDGAVKFLKQQAEEIGLPCDVIDLPSGLPVVLMTWIGRDPSLPSILLNSHMDVVPVFQEHWKYDAFEAVKEDGTGDIYGRGTQDMKCVGMQYLEAIRRLKSEKKIFLRNVYLTFVPDEELGGLRGMKMFLDSEVWRRLNVGFGLDEGLANPRDEYTVFCGERHTICIRVTCKGNTGHGSRFIKDNPGEKLRKVLNSFLQYRDEQERLLESNLCNTLGNVTTVNLTMIEGGVQHNVVPTEFSAVFDIRVRQADDLTQFEEKVHSWCEEAGSDVTFTRKFRFENSNLTSVSPEDPWWSAFSAACEQMKTQVKTEIFPAGTDSRFLRSLGIPVLGFSPLNNTPILLHDHNERLNEKVFLRGIDVYCAVLSKIANVPSLA